MTPAIMPWSLLRQIILLFELYRRHVAAGLQERAVGPGPEDCTTVPFCTGDRRPRTSVYCNEVGTRHLAALFVVLSLMGPPLVGLTCVRACAVGTHDSTAVGYGMDMAGPTLSGHRACAHDVGTVELFSPTAKRLPAPLDFVTEIVPRSTQTARAGLPSALSGLGPLDELALSPPGFSPVLRI